MWLGQERFQPLYDSVFGKKSIPPVQDFVDNPIFQKIYSAPQNNLNQIITVVGLPRTGKSELCLYGAWALDRDEEGRHLFEPRKQIVKTVEELVNFIETENRVGANVIWEEAGISEKGAAAREWQKKQNILLNDVFQLMGLKRQIIWINLPRTFFLDKGPRSLSHWWIETKGISQKSETCNAVLRVVDWDRKRNEPRNLKYGFFRHGRYVKSYSVSVPRAPAPILKEYYDIQTEYKKKWIKEIKERIVSMGAEEKKEKQKLDIGEAIKTIDKDADYFWDKKNKKPAFELIAYRFGIGINKARVIGKAWEAEKRN